MREAVGPPARLRVTAELLGCWKLTDAWLPMSKFCQLMMARWLPWLIVMAAPVLLMVACPALTCPPPGSAVAARSAASAAWAPMARVSISAAALRLTWPRLPRAEAISGATTQAFSCSFQISR